MSPGASISPEVYHGDPRLRIVKGDQRLPRRISFSLAKYHQKPLTFALRASCLFHPSSLQRTSLEVLSSLPWLQQSFLKIECARWPRRKELVQIALHASMPGDRPGKAAAEPRARRISGWVSPWRFEWGPSFRNVARLGWQLAL